MPQVRDDGAVIIVEKSSGGIGGFLFGLLVGAGAALLLAPQSGEATRRVIRDRSKQLRDEAHSRAEDWGDRIEEGYESAKERLEEGFDTARRTVRRKRADAEDALQAGKAAVTSARDELERRLADSRSSRRRPEAEDEAETDA
jgi:gas vesicle protein